MESSVKICQSCGMPLDKDPNGGGTNSEGNKSEKYCSVCLLYEEFADEEILKKNIELYIQNIQIAVSQLNMPENEAGKTAESLLPNLERWNNLNDTENIRQDNEMPEAIDKWGWKYHHLGVPTNVKFPDEKYLPRFKVYVSGFSTSPFGIEWMRYEADSPIHKLIQAVPHIAFEVKDLDYELATRKFNVITEPNPPSEGVRVAMIEYNGAPIELIEFEKNKE